MPTINPEHYKAKELRVLMREFLIRHAAGPQPIVIGERDATRGGLLRRELIQYKHHPNGVRIKFPIATELTEMGRKVACIILAEMAELLMLSEPMLDEIASPPTLPHEPEGVTYNQEIDMARRWAAAIQN